MAGAGYQVADHILIPLLDGRRILAQVTQVQGTRIVLYLTAYPYGSDLRTFAISEDRVLAVLATDIATLTAHQWPVIGYETIPTLKDAPIDLASPDTTLHDPAIIEAFANALRGLYPWDGFPDAALFTNLLRDPETQPAGAKMGADFPKDP